MNNVQKPEMVARGEDLRVLGRKFMKMAAQEGVTIAEMVESQGLLTFIRNEYSSPLNPLMSKVPGKWLKEDKPVRKTVNKVTKAKKKKK